MRMTDPNSSGWLGLGSDRPALQRKCECEEEEKEKETGTEEKKNAPLQRKEEGGTFSAPPRALTAIGSGGRTLDPETRAFMEPRFGFDFGRVRIHAGSEAAEAARSINARAYTSGPDVVFGSGRYAPSTSEGRHLLAHELTHVVQQGHASELPKSSAESITAAGDNQLQRKVESKPLPNWGSSFFNQSKMTFNAVAILTVDGKEAGADWGLASDKPASFKVPKCTKNGELEISASGYWFMNNSFGNLGGEGKATIKTAFDVNEKGEVHFKAATSNLEAAGDAATMTASGTSADNPPNGGSLAGQVAITANDQKTASVGAGYSKSSAIGSGNSFARGYRADVVVEKKDPIQTTLNQSVYYQVGKHQVIGSKDPVQPANISQIYAFLRGLPKEVRKDLEEGTNDKKAKIEVLAKASVTTPADPGAGSNVELTEKRRDAVVRLLQDFLGGGAKIKAKAIGELEATDPGEAGYERVATITVSWEDDPCKTGSSPGPGR
jgi:hypothetical protein